VLDDALTGPRGDESMAITPSTAASLFPPLARSARWAFVVLAFALPYGGTASSARADVIRLSHQQALRALAQPGPGPTARQTPGGGAPTVTTGSASAITASSATVSGTVNPNRRSTTYHFDYGTTTAYGSRAPSPDASLGADKTTHAVSADLTGLVAGTVYHFRLVATNCGGCPSGTSYGADATFNTAAAAPPPETYTNPVYGSFPDPMALRTSSDYYSYGTGTNFPILHSTDLVNWSSAGTAFSSSTFPSWSTGNPWSPSVLATPVTSQRTCPGFNLPLGATCFRLYYTGLNSALPTASNCVGVATSDRPDGGFRDQGILSNGTVTSRGPVGCGDAVGYSNIDPAPFIDADGQAYLYFETGHDASGATASTISVIRLEPDLIHAVGARQPLLTGTQSWEQRGSVKIVEGPWPHRRGSRYYLFYSGGDWQGAYGMGYGVGSSPLGPFTKSPTNPILKGTSAVVGPGGGSVVTGPLTQADQMIYHARAAAGQPRTLRIDRLIWNDSVEPAAVVVNGPTTTPQPLP
jgi:Glycosyl hydrolases family 43